jgi:alpha-glucan, water dikinase
LIPLVSLASLIRFFPAAPRYAGAGLFDSVQSQHPVEVAADYSSDQLLADAAHQRRLLGRVAAAAAAVEAAMGGSPQDVEGVLTADGQLYVVQTRPQV